MASGRTVALNRDGTRAVVSAGGTLHFVATDASGAAGAASKPGEPGAVDVPLAAVHDVASVGNQIWIAAGHPARLHRFAETGESLGAPLALDGDGGDAGVLRATEVGAPGAIWTAAPAFVTETSVTRVPGEPEWVVPITRRRWVACGRDRVALRDETAERWNVRAPGGRVVDGSALLDGRSVALIHAAPGGELSALVVLAIHDGALQQRITLANIDLVRFAPARGYAVLRSDARRLVVVDLRFGKVIHEHRDDRDILDLAIDAAGQALLLRYGDGPDDVVITSVRDLIAGARATAVAAAAAPSAGELAWEPTWETIEPPPESVRDFHRGPRALDVRAWPPRLHVAQLPPPTTMALLDHYRDYVRALAGRAIAAAWNDGRLTFANESPLPFKAEVVGLLGGDSQRAVAELDQANARVEQTLAALTASDAATGAIPSPLAALASELALSPIAREMLLVIAAPALWGDLARLYGILSNDDARPLVDEWLVSQLLARDVREYEIARELDHEAPLVRHGLVQIGAGRMRPFLPLRCEQVVLRLLRGTGDALELEGVRVVGDALPFDDLLIPAATKQAIAERVARPPLHGPGRIVVRGRVGSGRHTLLATLAAASGRQLGVVDATVMVRDLRARADDMRAAIRRAHLVGLVPCVDGLESLASDDQASRDIVREILDDHPGPLALRVPWDMQPPLAPGYTVIDLPALSIDQRMTCWQVLLAKHGLSVPEPEELATHYSVGPGVIVAACRQAASAAASAGHAAADDRPLDLTRALEDAIRQHLETRLRITATRVTRLATWSKVVLPTDIHDSVLELIARIKHRRQVYDVWGYDQVLTTSRGVTALFSGGPGTGKTLIASAIANELGMDLYRVDLSRVMSKWIGETEQNLAKLFDAAEDGHAIILFDEADSLFAKRTEVRSSVDRYANLEVNYLLQRFDTFEGIAILTTNFGTAIDGAFKRRLSFRLTIPFPDEEARESLWRAHVPPNVPRGGELDFGGLARRYQVSGGYIRNAALRAAFIAAEEHSSLRQDHLERAIEAEFREIGKFASTGILE